LSVGGEIRITSQYGMNLRSTDGAINIESDNNAINLISPSENGMINLSSSKYITLSSGSIGIGSEFFDEQSVSEYLIEPEDAFMGLPAKDKTLHKYSNGKVLVIAGSGGYPGAAALTTNSVLKSIILPL